jgi:hypothetical protein
MYIFLDVVPCSLLSTDQGFRDAYLADYTAQDPSGRRENLKSHRDTFVFGPI